MNHSALLVIGIALLAIAWIMLAGCQNMIATPGERYAAEYDASRLANTDASNPVPGMAERIEAKRRPSTGSLVRYLNYGKSTRTIHCNTMTGGRITTTRCR